MEVAALEVEGLAALANALLTGAQGTEVLSSLGSDISTQLQCNKSVEVSQLYSKEQAVVDHRTRSWVVHQTHSHLNTAQGRASGGDVEKHNCTLLGNKIARVKVFATTNAPNNA